MIRVESGLRVARDIGQVRDVLRTSRAGDLAVFRSVDDALRR